MDGAGPLFKHYRWAQPLPVRPVGMSLRFLAQLPPMRRYLAISGIAVGSLVVLLVLSLVGFVGWDHHFRTQDWKRERAAAEEQARTACGQKAGDAHPEGGQGPSPRPGPDLDDRSGEGCVTARMRDWLDRNPRPYTTP